MTDTEYWTLVLFLGLIVIVAVVALLSLLVYFVRLIDSRVAEVRYRAGFNAGYAHLREGLAARGDSAELPLDSALAVYKRVLTLRPDDPDALGLVRLAGRAEFACTQHAMKTVVWIARLWVLAVLAAWRLRHTLRARSAARSEAPTPLGAALAA